MYLVHQTVVAHLSRSSRAAIRPHCSSLPATGRRLHYASSGQLGSARLALCSTQLTITGSITSPSFRSKRLQAGYRPPAHCLSAIAVCCSLASLARPRAVVALAMQDGRARAPVRLVAPVRSQTCRNIYLCWSPCGVWGSLGRGGPRPALGRLRVQRALWARVAPAPCRALPSLRSGESGLAPRGLRSAPAEYMSVGRGGLPSISGPAVRLP